MFYSPENCLVYENNKIMKIKKNNIFTVKGVNTILFKAMIKKLLFDISYLENQNIIHSNQSQVHKEEKMIKSKEIIKNNNEKLDNIHDKVKIFRIYFIRHKLNPTQDI